MNALGLPVRLIVVMAAALLLAACQGSESPQAVTGTPTGSTVTPVTAVASPTAAHASAPIPTVVATPMAAVLANRYAIELEGGVTCHMLGGATKTVMGERLNYGCDDGLRDGSEFGSVAIGVPRRDESSGRYVIRWGESYNAVGQDALPTYPAIPGVTEFKRVVAVSDVMTNDPRCYPGQGTPYPPGTQHPQYTWCWLALFENNPTMIQVP